MLLDEGRHVDEGMAVAGALKVTGLDGLSMDLEGIDLLEGTDLGDDRADSGEWKLPLEEGREADFLGTPLLRR